VARNCRDSRSRDRSELPIFRESALILPPGSLGTLCEMVRKPDHAFSENLPPSSSSAVLRSRRWSWRCLLASCRPALTAFNRDE
jgi:hypothetical protein